MSSAVYAGSFESYLGRVLCKTRLIFSGLHVNDPNVYDLQSGD